MIIEILYSKIIWGNDVIITRKALLKFILGKIDCMLKEIYIRNTILKNNIEETFCIGKILP